MSPLVGGRARGPRGTAPGAAAVRRAPRADSGASATAAALLALLSTVLCSVPLAAQEDGRPRNCRLVLASTTDSTRSVTVEVAEGRYVTHVGGGLRWTCGGSRMVADSAVRHEAERRLKMIGHVDYRDSVRTLLADTVTYYEAADRIVAEGDVRLTRRASGSTLRGPRIEFFRATGEGPQRTVATGRPHMTIRPDTAARDTSPPVEVDADSVVLVGEEARTWRDVVITRPDTRATADSAFFHREEGLGELYGSPEVVGETYRLTGRTIQTGFEGGELRTVEAIEEARAVGDDFRLFAPRIRARLRDDELQRLWAVGEGGSVAFAPPYRLSADSLQFAFAGGEIDTLAAVGGARAVEVGDSLPEDPLAEIPLSAGERSWMAADTLRFDFGPREAGPEAAGGRATAVRPDSLPAAPTAPPGRDARGAARDRRAATDSVEGADGGPGPAAAADRDRQIERLTGLGDARAYYILEPDAENERPGLHYQRGRRIVIHFEDGEARRLEGRTAIGVHLDPTEGRGVQPDTAPEVPPREVPRAPPTDSLPAEVDTMPPDTTSGVDGQRGPTR